MKKISLKAILTLLPSLMFFCWTNSTVAQCTTGIQLAIDNSASTPNGGDYCSSATTITYSATVFGANSGTYTWYTNTSAGNFVGTSTYSPAPTANSLVYCIFTPNTPCTGSYTSNTITLGNPQSSFASSVSLSGASTACSGTNVTFTATPTNGGSNPTFQFFVNGTAVTGNTSSFNYTTNSLTNGQIVTCVMTTSCSCASPLTSTSNSITMTINSLPTVSSITTYDLGSRAHLCNNTIYGFTDATPGGVWSVTSNLVPSSNVATFSLDGLGGAYLYTPSAGNGTVNMNYTVTDANGCSTTLSTGNITVGGATDGNTITSLTGGYAVVCSGASHQLHLSNAGSYGSWYSDNTAALTVSSGYGVMNGVSTTTSNANIYCVTMSSNGCYYTISTPAICDQPTGSMCTTPISSCYVSGNWQFCYTQPIGMSATATGVGNMSYSWSSTNGLGGGPTNVSGTYPLSSTNYNASASWTTATPDLSGTYTVSVTDAAGCSASLGSSTVVNGNATGNILPNPVSVSITSLTYNSGSNSELLSTSGTTTNLNYPAPFFEYTHVQTAYQSTGGYVVLTATPVNAGTSPYYTWFLNGVAITGSGNHTYALTINYHSLGACANISVVVQVTHSPGSFCSSPSGPVNIPIGLTANSPVYHFNSTKSVTADITSMSFGTGTGTTFVSQNPTVPDNSPVLSATPPYYVEGNLVYYSTLTPAQRTSLPSATYSGARIAFNGASYGPAFNTTAPQDYSNPSYPTLTPGRFAVLAQNGCYRVWNVFVTESSSVNKQAEPNGIADLSTIKELTIYPNPASTSITIATVGGKDVPHLSIVDMMGRVVYSRQLTITDQIMHQVDVSAFAEGTYIVRVSVGDRIEDKEFIVKK